MLLVLLAAGCHTSNSATRDGTVLGRWDSSMSSPDSPLRSAHPRGVEAHEQTFELAQGGSVRVRFTTGTAEMWQGPMRTVLSAEAVLDKNVNWTISHANFTADPFHFDPDPPDVASIDLDLHMVRPGARLEQDPARSGTLDPSNGHDRGVLQVRLHGDGRATLLASTVEPGP